MSELRKLRGELERLYPRALDLFRQHRSYSSGDINGESKSHNLFRAKDLLWRTICALSRVIVEQEALCPTPQVNRAYAEVEPKGSSVEFYQDQVIEKAIDYCNLAKPENPYWGPLALAVDRYKSALAASPNPEGEWQWVPVTHVVAPKMVTSVMCAAGQNAAEDKIDCVEVGQIYRAILAARPPVPKKGESV